MAGKVDFHHHFIPPRFADAVRAAGPDPSGWFLPSWDASLAKKNMEDNKVSFAVLSLTAPGVEVVPGKNAQRAMAREINEYATKLRDDNPSSFGFFAALPSLMDVEGTLEEIKHAFDVLKADGVTLFTRYGSENHYLGHELFIPIWKELNDRKAVIFVHPISPADPRLASPLLPNPVIDYPHETTRAALDLVTSNRKRENPDCKIILSHGGGTLPFLSDRAAKLYGFLPLSPKTEDEVLEDMKSFYCDLALSTSEISLSAVRRFFGDDRIVFGSDFPYAPAELGKKFVDQLEGQESGLGGGVKEKLYFGNAKKLIPRLDAI